MQSTFRQGVRSCGLSVVVVMIAVLAASYSVSAQTHVVSSAELRQQMLTAAQTRAANTRTVTDFFSSSAAQKALQRAHLDSGAVKAAVAGLSDAELAQMAVRAGKAQTDFAAGDLSDRDLLIIIVGIAALILIIVAVR